MGTQQSMEGLKIKRINVNTEALQFLLKKQSDLDKIYGQQTTETWDQKVYWLMKKWMAMEDELNEFKNWLPWKWWTKKIVSPEKASLELKYELVDLFHFWLSSCNTLEMDAQEIIDIYMAKNKENYDRQERGY
jgi:dimeric dUTPase (all-alpha-NTP-PPase superfamily)